MKRERTVLSARDRELLEHRFCIKEPQKLSGLTERIEKGAVPVRILHGYDETPQGGRKAGHKPHIRCAFGHLHWHGFVVELEDGRTALIGEDCARDHFGKEIIDHIEGVYNDQKDRQFEVRRLMAIRAAFPAAFEELRALTGTTAVQGFDAFWKTLSHKHGKASRELAACVRSSQGRLIDYRKERDERAEEIAAKKSKPELFDAVDTASTLEARRIAVGRLKKFLDSQPHRYKEKPVDIGPCDGWRLLNGSERPLAKLIGEAVLLGARIDQAKPIEQWGKSDFARMRRTLDELFAKLDEASGIVADLVKLTSSANLERIADWAHQRGQNIQVSDLELPPGYAWPQTPAIDALRAAREDSSIELALAA